MGLKHLFVLFFVVFNAELKQLELFEINFMLRPCDCKDFSNPRFRLLLAFGFVDFAESREDHFASALLAQFEVLQPLLACVLQWRAPRLFAELAHNQNFGQAKSSRANRFLRGPILPELFESLQLCFALRIIILQICVRKKRNFERKQQMRIADILRA